MMERPSRVSIDLYWLPLGAGGHSVRLNGRIYEAVAAWLGADLCILARLSGALVRARAVPLAA